MSSLVVWSDHKAFLLHGLQQLYSTGRHSDLEIKCHDRSFKVHKLVLGLFTDYFNECDGLWMRINVNVGHMETILNFFYRGQVVVSYDQMEGFLSTCKLLRIKLFKGATFNAEGMTEEDCGDQELQQRYELSDFKLICTNCYKCFPDDKTLKKHTWGCQRPRNFKCRFCDNSFRHKNDVMNHERTHTKERPFVCPREACEKTFSLKSHMARHVREEHDKIPYPCDLCDQKFDSVVVRRYHKAMVHSVDKPYACVQCGKCFAMSSLLRQHMFLSHASKEVRKKRNQLLQAKGRQKRKMAANGQGKAKTEEIING